MSSLVRLVLNGKMVEVAASSGMRLLDLVRAQGLTGTKEGCGDGDCGACTVLMGSRKNGKVFYRSVPSCLIPAAKAAGTSVVTVEAMRKDDGGLNIIQKSLVENYGIQCGFCTPGIVMALAGSMANGERPTYEELLGAMDGNICRCTGYEGIRKSAKAIAAFLETAPASFDILPESVRKGGEAILEDRKWLQSDEYYLPATKEEFLALWREHKGATILAGNSDHGVRKHFDLLSEEDCIIDISRVAEFSSIVGTRTGSVATVSDVMDDKGLMEAFPVLKRALPEMASRHIRNTASFGGNIANASPIADGVVLLMALDAKLQLLSMDGSERTVPLRSFYTGYKTSSKKSDEIIESIILEDNRLDVSFIKTSKRSAVDIAAINSAAVAEGKSVRFIFGGVAPVVSSLVLEIEEAEKMAEKAAAAFNPISDVYASAWYRKELIKGHVIKHMEALKEGGSV